MKKLFTTILTVVLAASIFTGCNNGKDTMTEGKVNLTIGLPGGDGVTPMAIADNFIEARKDKYNITLDTAAWNDFMQKIKLQFTAKLDVTPVFFTDSLEAPSLGAQGAIEDLKPLVDRDLDASKYSKALFALTDTEGHLWGVPHGLNSIAMIYNKDIFDEKGIAYPSENWTFEEMINLARELTFDRDGDGKKDVYGIMYGTNITQGWLPFLASVGASPYKDNFRNANLDDPKVAEGYKLYQAPVMEGLLPEDAEIAAWGSRAAAFAEGKVAMYLCQMSELRSINKFNPELNYAAEIMPFGKNGERPCIYVPNVWVMYKNASNEQKDAAWDWIQHFLSEESQMLCANEGISLPILNTALEAVGNTASKPEGKTAFFRGIDEYGMTILENPCSSECEQILQPLSGKIRQGGDVDALLKEANVEMQETLDFYYENL